MTSRKDHIIEVAAELFRTKGYTAVTMRELAEQVGIEASSLYSHFEKKEDILWEIANMCASDFEAAIIPIAESHLHTQKKLQEMMIVHVDVTLKHRQSAVVFVTEWKNLSEPRLSDYANRRDEYEKLFRNVIAQGIQENLFKQMEEKFAAITVLSALNWTYLWYKPEGELTPGQIGETLSEILLHGLIRNY